MKKNINKYFINGERLWNSLIEMSKIGPGICGGNNRQALTDEDAKARDLLKKWCKAEDLKIGIDKIGTMFARRDGIDPSLHSVLIGSHLDTQPAGGKYDGVLGTLAGLEIIRTLNDQKINTLHSIELVNWTNEEGCRFAPPMLGSGVFAGVHDLDWAYKIKDSNGKSLLNELERIGWKGDEEIGIRKIAAFFELHIEQGPVLEDDNIDIGVVTHAQGLNWLKVTLIGKEAHAGSTPMTKRINAGLGMAKITQLVNEIALSYSPNAVGTVGYCDMYPNSHNTIPGKAVFSIDFRHPKKQIINEMENKLREGASNICNEIGLKINIENISKFDPVAFDNNCVKAIRQAAKRLDYSYLDIVSGAVHDACRISKVAPTAMIMCPCVDGLSHNEAEKINIEWSTSGANVLLNAVLDIAGVC